MKRFSITYGQSGYWKAKIWPKDKEQGLRYGQSFCNHFLPAGDSFPILFYETNTEKAKELIEKNTEYRIV